MTKLRSAILPSLATVSLVTAFAACGSYSSTGSSAGTSSSDSGAPSMTGAGTGNSANSGAGAPTTTGGDASGGGTTIPGAGTGGSANGSSGGDTTTGGTTDPGGAGGMPPGGGAAGAGTAGMTGMAGSGGTASGIALPCDVLTKGGTKCVSAHSTIRVIVPNYAGPLYQLCKGTAVAGPSSCKGTTQDIGAKDGYADSAAHQAFCGTATCKITKIYDQSGMGNHLEPGPTGQHGLADLPANAGDLKIMINGHTAYGILIKPGMGYRSGCTGCTIKTGIGMAKGDEPQTMYWVTSQLNLVPSCCFDYGNAETSSHDDKNGTMEALYFGSNTTWGYGNGPKEGGGPWMMADLEDGLYAGWQKAVGNAIATEQAIASNSPLKHDFVSGMVLGDTRDKNQGKGRFAVFGGDATVGALTQMYDDIRPEKPGYVPMQKEGSIILGVGGDNSNAGGGRFFEGAVATGPVASKQTLDALQAAIVATKYGQ